MEKFLGYVFMRDNNDYLLPSPIGHFIFVVLIFIICGISCEGNKEQEVKHIDMTIPVDTTAYSAEQVLLTDTIVSKGKYWSSKDIKVPSGVVFRKDYAGSVSKNVKDQNQSDNYVTIRAFNGQLSIVRDIDVDLYLNLEVGDTIK